MKSLKSVLVLFVLLVLSSAAWAQTPETVTIPKSSLTEQQKADLAAADLKAKTDQYGKWVGIGHEVGVAVNEGMSAVTTQANNFAQTPVGKWTMFVIIFKVIGNSAITYIGCFCLALIGIPVWLWSYRKYLPKKFLVKVNYDATTGKKISEEYNYGYGVISDGRGSSNSNVLDKDMANNWCVGHWGAIAVLTLVIIVMLINA